MSHHVYANVNDLKTYLVGATTWTTTTTDTHLLTLLEAASRRIDEWCDRSPERTSGFGPRTGINTYDAPGSTLLELRDDLLTITSVAAYDTLGGTPRTLTDGTDFLKKPYDDTPYLELEQTPSGSQTWGAFQTKVTGTWGYSNETYNLATGGTVNSSATSLILTGGTAYGGQTLLIDSEQVYVTATGGTATIVRARNGTTAAVHADGATVAAYRYPREVVNACLQLATYALRQAQAGLSGDMGGGNIPPTVVRSEASILRNTVGHLRRVTAG